MGTSVVILKKTHSIMFLIFDSMSLVSYNIDLVKCLLLFVHIWHFHFRSRLLPYADLILVKRFLQLHHMAEDWWNSGSEKHHVQGMRA